MGLPLFGGFMTHSSPSSLHLYATRIFPRLEVCSCVGQSNRKQKKRGETAIYFHMHLTHTACTLQVALALRTSLLHVVQYCSCCEGCRTAIQWQLRIVNVRFTRNTLRYSFVLYCFLPHLELPEGPLLPFQPRLHGVLQREGGPFPTHHLLQHCPNRCGHHTAR